ncbi:MAG: hypothetical protein US83_C0006G0083 [Candidatus Falkowbacteria bacterium GW2011_GWC2_38_22]|uniref:DUF4870 domain-containing protein n=1 Tax=Candidatus Falkowbacteria bacterium GW2011_GWE1_38_31 TaxID=1618638 RepID=A0A0G0N1P8_9BACT|nr:MAG: hypothetical protein US73_C0001G0003 [Candidatus Falkowbacteria bacterium GW2011_GWF2_38_1205]KKQ61443.1 MAG: hypothetical protein US83_C0006G0083 [Candidatus Falkowbacteria bacterium GW2011_GWC2_38_22]KKQ63971.1 MAG: hypothetical protein US84_C0002G0003 [Candidatus Falkowbacteria bacterium GW2011_GWF1_38_22]KKQ66680.1 MAG: hypothetical protein US87_C0001G0201 [Candidatus Falkowbacteria bacterium GW2011_GWE2_38_254]KKQ71076.1 MAG: hypothetical protein US91_C0001G0003 [Candidatus Falkowb
MSEEIKQTIDNDIEENKTVAALSYIWVLCLVPLITKKKSKFAQFHAKQGLALFIIEIIGTFVFWIPLIGWALAIAVLVVSILGILKALNGEWWKIPYVYDFSKKFNL